MAVVYSIAIRCYFLLLRFASLFNRRAKQFVQSRKGQSLLGSFEQSDKPILWIHCASHGEYETAKPIIAKYSQQYHIHITFYSPSGYNFVKSKTTDWDTIEYLPIDTDANAKRYINRINPAAVIFIQYEFWYHFLVALHKQSIPVTFYGTSFTKNYFLFKPYMSFLKEQVDCCDLVLVRDEESYKIAQDHLTCKVYESGEVRWLSCLKNKNEENSNLKVKKSETLILIFASIWKEDLARFKHCIELLSSKYHIIIAPHDLSSDNILLLESLMSKPMIKRSSQQIIDLSNPGTTLLDTLGELKYLYRHSNLSYIGGGFCDGLHNCIEAAIFKNPLIFGGNISNNPEALELVKHGYARVVETEPEMHSAIEELLSADLELEYGTYIDTQIEKCNTVYSVLDNFLYKL